MATVKCIKCGGENELDSSDKFIKCRYCESQMYIDKSGAGFFYILPYQPGFLTNEQVRGTFRRWTANPKMAKELETTARITQIKPQYFPIYMFKRDVSGQEQIIIEPAKSTTLPGMHSLKIPAGDIKIFDQKHNFGNIELIQPDINMNSYTQNLPGQSQEQALVYFPIWNITYEFQGKQYSSVIDGSNGEIFATEYPPRAEAPFLLISIGGFIAFFIEGIATLIFGISSGNFIIMMLLFGVIIATIVGILLGTYYVASKL